MAAAPRLSRGLLYALVAVYLLVGMPWFFRPAWSAVRFPWKVTDLMAMTIGAWCLGNAWWAGCTARARSWAEARSLLVYLLAFGVLEAGVALWFGDKLRTEEWMTWPYLAALALSVLAAGVGILEWRSRRTEAEPGGVPMPAWGRAFLWFFVLFVGFLALVAAWGPPEARDGRIFPEEMSPFTLRAFGAFYLSLAVGAAFLLRTRTTSPMAAYGTAGLGLVALITVTIPVYADVWDLGEHPFQLLYIAAYVGVLVITVTGLAWHRRLATPSNLRQFGPPHGPD